MKSKFTHLHVHSHYSLLQALPRIDELVKAAKKNGMQALALTDNGNLYGAIEFYKECKKKELKPIIGIDAFVAPRTRHDKESRIDNRTTRLVLLAKNLTGYRNLMKLVTESYVEGFYYKPRIDKETIEKFHEGLIVIMPSFGGETSHALKAGDEKKAVELIEWYKKICGVENFYLELTHHPEFEGHEELMKKVVSIAKKTKTPLVAAHDVYYLSPDDRQARRTLLSVQNGGDGGDRGDETEDNFSFITSEEAEKLFKDTPEALENTVKIADACNLELTLGTWVFPTFEIPGGRTPDEELRRITYEGIAGRGLTKTKEIEDRVEYELTIIKNKGYAPYFLVVSDLLAYAHKNGILTNIRGSVAGSMVTYLSRITNVNPLEYKLPFERFLNPERPSAPDIDMDYADDRRDEMIDYARKKYGAENVAQIGTFGTMMARGSVRDVARALGFAYTVGDRIAKLIPMGAQGFPMTIKHAIELVPELKELYESDADTKTVIDMALKIEGCARHISVHAAGVVIAPTNLTDFTPLQLDPKGTGKLISQYDMYAIEEAGLLKFDFLGIKNLSILAKAISLVEKLEGTKLDIDTIPLDDKKTFEMLARGETEGTFQLNGDGMTRYLKELRPSTIHDINAMVALYRPGPLESIPKYIERKHNPKLISYIDPRLKEILSQSYGVITYQDDVLLTAIHLAGYSWLDADKLRKAMGKKIPEEMEAQKEKLIEGFVKHGTTREVAQGLWKLIEPFAAYGFNKAHAASYGRVAYQTSYMKANYPAIYMSAVLTADAGDVEKIAVFINECTRMGIPVLPPDVNESFSGFTVVRGATRTEDKIRFGLMSIKNFGEGIANTIIEEREKGGRFQSLENFLERIKDKNLNKKSLEALIMSGALDHFGERGQLLGNIELLLEYHKEHAKGPTNQDSLFGGVSGASPFSGLSLKNIPPAAAPERLAWEKELLGLYISGHPLDQYKHILEKKETNIKRIKEELKENMIAVVSGVIESVRVILTKTGSEMAFIKMCDLSGSMEVVAFPKIYSEFKELIADDKAISVKGKISHRNETVSLLIDKIKPLA
jgi:DNA polymerase-3 subunit alpha